MNINQFVVTHSHTLHSHSPDNILCVVSQWKALKHDFLVIEYINILLQTPAFCSTEDEAPTALPTQQVWEVHF